MELESKVKLGEFYKELRLARKVKQKDVAKGKLSKSQLSKFESGQSMLSADRMISAIEGINLTFAEFGHVLNGYRLTDYEELMKHIMTLLTNEDKGGLEALLERYLNQGDSVYLRLNSLVIKNAIHSLDREYTFNRTDGNFLAEYLFSIEDWTSYDLHIFGNTLPILSDTDLIFLGKELVSRSKVYLPLTSYRKLLKLTYLNIISEMFERKQLTHVQFFITELESLLDVFDTFEMILLNFLKLTYSYLYKGTQKECVEIYIENIKRLNLDSLADLLTKRLFQYEQAFIRKEEK